MAQKAKKKISIRFFVIIFCLLMAYAGFLLVKQQLKIHEINNKADTLSQEIAQMKDENEQLERDIEQSYTDEYVEQQARDKLGWVKENEIRFIEKEN